MSQTKATLYLDKLEYERLQRMARARGTSSASLVREAIAEYNARHGATKRPRSVGMGRSGKGNLSEHDEDLLEGMGESR